MEKFLWNDKRRKIPKNVMQANKNEGGAGFVNFELKDLSLKVKWVQTLNQDTMIQYSVTKDACKTSEICKN